MLKVTLSELCHTKKPVEVLKTGSELYFCTLVDYCFKELTNGEVTLDVSDVAISETLYHTAYVEDCISCGLQFTNIEKAKGIMNIVPYSAANVKLLALSEYLLAERYAVADDTAVQVQRPTALFEMPLNIAKDDPNRIVAKASDIAKIFGYKDPVNNIDAYLYVAAMITVTAYLSETPKTLTFIDDSVTQHTEFAHILINMYMANKLLEFLDIQFLTSIDNLNEQKWAATLLERKQKGGMLPKTLYTYTVKDKKKWLADNNIHVGSVFVLYERVAGNNAITHGVVNCYPCVVNGIHKDTINLLCINTLHTKQTVKHTVERFMAEGNTLYTESDKTKFAKAYRTLNIEEIGIGDCTNLETEILLELSEGTVEQNKEYIIHEDKEKILTLDDVDLFYAVLRDQEVSFDRKQYLEKYYKPFDRTPVYDTYFKYKEKVKK